MGYRSNVLIIVYGAPEKMDAFVARMKLQNHPALNDPQMRRETRCLQAGPPDAAQLTTYDMLVLAGDGWKWYPGYPEVEMWCSLLDTIDEIGEDLGIAYEFVRIGEDQDDNEIRQGGDDAVVEYFLTVERSIRADLPGAVEGEEAV